MKKLRLVVEFDEFLCFEVFLFFFMVIICEKLKNELIIKINIVLGFIFVCVWLY